MKSAIIVFVAIGTAFILLDTATSIVPIKCFVCNSFHQADCADWFDNVTQHLVRCPDGYRMCRKVVQEVWLDDHWDVRYIRQCAADGVIGDRQGRHCQERYGSYNVRMRYCHCDNQDGCNSAPALMPSGGFHQFLPLVVTLIASFMPYILTWR
ncbi:UPAR/Ly6 domain-containing protein crok-like [Babylonia areolata]|uniref:UPAR/Ly6 domain-containing protein crok-like n=1 Tax=Babylonia areolata TaxID=304850 RepID=UPI003FD65F37